MSALPYGPTSCMPSGDGVRTMRWTIGWMPNGKFSVYIYSEVLTKPPHDIASWSQWVVTWKRRLRMTCMT